MTRVVLVAFAVLAACGGSSNTDGGRQYDIAGLGPDFGKPYYDGNEPPDLTGADLAGDMAMTVVVADPPMIVVTSPTSTVDVTVASMPIDATVTSTATPPRAITSVVATLAGATSSIPLASTGTKGDYTAMMDVSSVAGLSSFVITATDAAGAVTSQQFNFRRDAGPVITFIAPTVPTGQSIITAKSSLSFVASVADPLYTVSTVTAAVGEGPVTVTASSTAGQYQGTITFNDPEYSPALSGQQQLSVTATNSMNVSSTKVLSFTVDDQGPTIVVNSPVAGDFYGGILTISAMITDESGINNSTVIAQFGGNASYYADLDPDPNTAGLYTGTFDLRKLGTTSYVTPAFDLTASDTLGNTTTIGFQFVLDNTPPIVDMDPPNIRVAQYINDIWQCSIDFDPLGDDAIDDQYNPPSIMADWDQEITVRARIEDRGNIASGQSVERISGIDPSSVNFYAIPVPNGSDVAFAVDSDGDGECDEVNPLLTQVSATGGTASSSEYEELSMTQITQPGSIDYSDTTSALVGICQQMGASGAIPPGPLCTKAGTDLEYTLLYSDSSGTGSGQSTVWTLPVVNNSTDTGCMGYQYDTLNHMPEGGACFVVAAKDNTGNKVVSVPLRTCIRRSSMVNHPCDSWTPPNCTGAFDPVNNVVIAGTCTHVKGANPPDRTAFDSYIVEQD